MARFRYAATSSWNEWQREYRYGAFYIFPPPGVIEPLDDLRHRYDPEPAASCQAHISLSEPLPGPLTDAGIQELRSVLVTFEPFEIGYGPLRVFDPYPGVAYAIGPHDTFMRLRAVVHATSVFQFSPLSRKDVPPHLTIAEFITLERSHDLRAELQGNVPEGTFWCGAIEYAVPDDGMHFQRVLTIPVGGGSASGGRAG